MDNKNYFDIETRNFPRVGIKTKINYQGNPISINNIEKIDTYGPVYAAICEAVSKGQRKAVREEKLEKVVAKVFITKIMEKR